MIEDGEDARYVTLADDGMIESRDLLVDGRPLTLKIESSYWGALEDICRREEMRMEELISDIRFRLREQTSPKLRAGEDAAMSATSVANAVRVFVVGYFRQAATEAGHQRAGHGRGDLFLQTPVDPPLFSPALTPKET